ncbi:MAG: DUF1570 domain-containing protein [Pirellulaceae bacterium]|nr:DUF1570 domain-containing protein [Pirellulaceae bacterium]
MNVSYQRGLLLALAIFATSNGMIGWAQPPRNLQVDSAKGRFVGLPIHWGRHDAALLQTSGRIELFEQAEIDQHQLLGEVFQPQSSQQAKLALQAELGPSFETLVAGPYVIGAPQNQARRWETRFRSLLAGYQRFFEVRGWPLRAPDFPLVVIVLPTRQEFVRWGSQEVGGRVINDNLVGMYVPRTNRCLLYNISIGNSPTNWEVTEATIVHEAIHQLAYNTGLHERLFAHPLWFVEGLATLFEVPAVYEVSLGQPSPKDRVHPEKYSHIKHLLHDTDALAAGLESLIASDQMFQSDPQIAYALSWALNYYLIERLPQKYLELVDRQRQRGFHAYAEGDRQFDFRAAFETTPPQLALQIQQLLRSP